MSCRGVQQNPAQLAAPWRRRRRRSKKNPSVLTTGTRTENVNVNVGEGAGVDVAEVVAAEPELEDPEMETETEPGHIRQEGGVVEAEAEELELSKPTCKFLMTLDRLIVIIFNSSRSAIAP